MNQKRNNQARLVPAPILLMVTALLACLPAGLSAQPAGQQIPQLQNVSIKQRLNAQVPLDLTFQDETGRTVALRDYFGRKPVVLSLAYYRCPMLCTMVLTGLTKALKVIQFNVGDEFDVITVSIDPRETPPLAAAKKEAYLADYARPGAVRGWHFLTGKQMEITRLANAVGFGFEYDRERDQFAHAAAIMVITPQGRVSKYFYGIEYSARDLRLGLVEAAAGKVGTPVDQLMMYCFHYDPQTGKYSMSILKTIRLAGVLTVLSIVALVCALYLRDRRRRAAVPAWDMERRHHLVS